jgi:predicted lipid-binding transport protein (Tim44 family)
MNLLNKMAVTLVAACCGAGTALADLYVYPKDGQSTEQTDKDKFECYNWAKKDSGFDPMATPRTTSAAPSGQARSGTMVKGGLGGAAIGGLLGGRSGAGKGALAGGLIGGVHQHQHNKNVESERSQWEQQESDNYSNNRNNYNRAYAACLEGRGYSVK